MAESQGLSSLKDATQCQIISSAKLLIRTMIKNEKQSALPKSKEQISMDDLLSKVRLSNTRTKLLRKVTKVVIQSFPWKNITPADVLELAYKEQVNTYGLYYSNIRAQITVPKKRLMFGFGFYPSLSFYNHSCAPNTYKRREGTQIKLVALCDIPAGIEMCHSYIDLHENTNQRRNVLDQSYGFTCTCQRCEDEDYDLEFVENFVCPDINCGGLFITYENSLICINCGYEKE